MKKLIKGTSFLLAAMLAMSIIGTAFSSLKVNAETFSNVPEFPDFDMDCYVADLFTTDGHTLNTLIELELNSESRNRIMKNSIESNSVLMGSMTAWQIATFQASDTSHDSITQVGYYESIILSALNSSIKSSTIKDVFDNAAMKSGKGLFSSYKSILKAEYALEFSDTASFNSLNSAEQKSVLDSFEKAFKKQYPKINDAGKFLKIFGNLVKCAKSIEECMGLFTSYVHCGLVNEYLCQVVNDLYEQCSDSNVTMKAALLNISSACTSTELDLDAISMDIIYRGFDIIYGYVVDAWFDSVIAAHPAGLGLIIGQAIGKGVSNFLFSTDEICENYYKMCCLDEFEQLLRSVTRYEMSKYKTNRTDFNANCIFAAVGLVFNLNEIGCDYSIDYAKTIYEKSVAGIFLDKTEYENYKKTVEFIRRCKQADYSTLMTSYIFYLEEDYPEIYAAYMKLMDEIENPVVNATGIGFAKKHMTLGLSDDMFYFWNNAEVTPSNATNRTVSYTSSNESIVSIKSGNTLMIELHQVGTATITATAEDGGFTDFLTIDVVEGHGTNGIHLEDPATDVKASGKCGDSAYWNLYNNGILKIYGSGQMKSYLINENIKAPWYDKRNSVNQVIICNGIDYIGGYAFYNCTNLKSVIIPDSIETIGFDAFYGCSSLASIIIPDSVKTILFSAFYGCSSLTNVTIPNSVINVSSDIFEYCTSLSQIIVAEDNAALCSIDGNLYSKDKTTLLQYALGKKNTSFSVPFEVHHICYNAFRGCSNLKKIRIDYALNISDGAFDSCSNLTIYGYQNSDAHRYALEHNIPFVEITSEEPTTEEPTIEEPSNPVNPDNIKTGTTGDCKWALYDDTLTISGDGNMNDWSTEQPLPSTWIEITKDITQVIIENGVIKIGNRSFESCKKLTRVSIPDSVTCIGDDSFCGCSGLENLTIPKSVTSIGDYSFYGCTSLSSITIPKSVTSIGDTAFKKCNNLTIHGYPNSYAQTYAINNNIPFIELSSEEPTTEEPSNPVDPEITESGTTGDCTWTLDNEGTLTISGNGKMGLYGYSNNISPWYSCRNEIQKIVFYDGVQNVGDFGFQDCSNLKSVTISNTVVSIGENAFYKCNNLTKVIIPSSVSNIGFAAFAECTNLTEISFPNAITSVGVNAFIDTAWYNNQPDGLVYIGKVLYKNKGNPSNNTAINIRADIVSITGYAFEDCTNIVSITIPDGVTSIGNLVFYGCTSLTSMTLPNSIVDIGATAFGHCTNLSVINLPNRITRIEKSMFSGCSKLANVSIPDTVTAIGDYAFYDCTSITNLNIPNGVTTIGSYAFQKCTSLTEIYIPNSVANIGAVAFSGCTNLNRITISNCVTNIENNTFSKCTSLTNITIPNSVICIGAYAFDDCTNLARITIPNSVKIIGSNAFRNTAWYNNQPDGLVYAGNVAYKYKGDMPENTSVYIKDGIKSISDSAFSSCTNLKSITIPDSVNVIGDDAFYNCINLNNVNLGNGLSSIGGNAFYNCDSLESVSIPNSVTNIYWRAFCDCENLKSVTIPNSVTSIDFQAFVGCKNLKEVHISDIAAWCKIQFNDSSSNPLYYAHNLYLNNSLITELFIPETISSIRKHAFYGCTSITNVIIPNTVTSVGFGAFCKCTSLNSITIPSSVMVIEELAFGYDKYSIIENFIIYGKADSAAENYANENNIQFVKIEENLDSVGDVNGDGVVDILDATVIQKYAVEKITLTDDQKKVADVNDDGIVDIRLSVNSWGKPEKTE